jgi:fructokinase
VPTPAAYADAIAAIRGLVEEVETGRAGPADVGLGVPGRNGIAGEWGHTPFPWAEAERIPAGRCWCGQLDCVETVVSSRALAIDCDGPGAPDAASVAKRAPSGDGNPQAALDRHTHQLARALSWVVDLLDPAAIVLGGGLSKMQHLYKRLPTLLPGLVFNGVSTPILPPVYGDSAGVRGAAWLWPPMANSGREPR